MHPLNIKNIRNYWFPKVDVNGERPRTNSAKSPAGYISPVQFDRLKADIQSWRDAVKESEQAYYPHRVKMQRILQDTILNGQVTAAMDKRKDLTLLKNFELTNGKEVNEAATEMLQKEWFYLLMNYILDAKFFGYTLIGFGDLVDDEFPKLELIKRWNVSPDRHTLNSYVYSLSGIDFMNPNIKDENGDSYFDWTLYIDTPTETGGSCCGYGLLYKLAYYEILIRSNIGYNATSLELFGIPIRKGTTTKQDEYERATFAAALRDMGSNGWILMDPQDQVELVESSKGGKGQNGFEDFETRMLKMINKVVLGHADAIDSQTGKLGAQDDVKEAIQAKEKADNRWMEQIINTKVIPKLQNLGLPIPIGLQFKIINNREKEEHRKKEDESNKITAEIFQTIKNAGGDADWKYFEERTGIRVEKAEEPEMTPLSPAVKTKLKALYK